MAMVAGRDSHEHEDSAVDKEDATFLGRGTSRASESRVRWMTPVKCIAVLLGLTLLVTVLLTLAANEEAPAAEAAGATSASSDVPAPVAPEPSGQASASSPAAPSEVEVEQAAKQAAEEVAQQVLQDEAADAGEVDAGYDAAGKEEDVPRKPLFDGTLPTRECPADNPYYPRMPKPKMCLDMNLLYLKGPKTGSSTMGGVARRIAARFGVNCVDCSLKPAQESEEPHVVANHLSRAVLRDVLQSARKRTFVWGLVRDPAERCLSGFYHFQATRHGQAATDANIIKFASGKFCKNMIWRYYDMDQGADAIDFLGVTDRYTESLVLLAHYLDLSIGDVLFTSSKVSTAAVKDVTAVSKKDKVLVPHVPLAQQSEAVRSYFEGAFQGRNAKDYAMFREANAKMDMLIAEIGKERFEAQHAALVDHLAKVKTECAPYLPDGSMREDIECYWKDNGCSVACLDEYATKNGLWEAVTA